VRGIEFGFAEINNKEIANGTISDKKIKEYTGLIEL
jgi:hypothetical protein